jgi:molybdopterin synthase catalytic subunit
MIKVEISSERFDMGAELAPLAALHGGALASFTGIARPDGAVVAIELEHYPAMTMASLNALVTEAQSRWALLGCVLIHRVGHIKMGEEIVLIGTASAHRKAALAATAFLIDRLKTDAPFWKKEIYADGRSEWVEAKGSDIDAGARWK